MKRPAAWAGAGAAVALALAVALYDPRIFVGGDNALYYALTKALATGRGYVDLSAPGAPLHAVYPPGYPLLMVPFYWIFGGSIAGLKVGSLVAAGVALWGVWGLARRDGAAPAWASAAAVAVVGLYPAFLDYAHWALSDMTYLAVTLLAVVAFLRARPDPDGPDPDPDRWTGAWLAGLALALLAFSVRTAGLTLLVAALVHAGFHRRWKRAAAAAGFVVAGAVPWIVWTTLHAPATGGYLQQLLASDRLDPESPRLTAGGFLLRSWDNVSWYAIQEWPRLFWPKLPVPTLVVVAAIFLGAALLAWGAARAFRARGVGVWDLHVAFTVVLLAAWPWTGDRFLMSVAPFLWLYVLAGLDGASRLWTRGAVPAMAVAGALAALLALGAAARVGDQWAVTRAHLDGDELAGYPVFWADYFEASAWVGRTAPDAVVVARKPTLAWYWSGRPSFVFPLRYQPAETWDYLRSQGATHVLYDNLGAADLFLKPALDLHAELIEVVHAAPARNVFVLRIAPPPAP